MNRGLWILNRLGLLAVIVLFWAIFVASADGFLTGITMFGLSRTIAVTAIVGLAQMLALSIGHMNLAVGAIGGLTGMFSAYLMEEHGLPIWLGIFCGLAVAAALGWLNGWLVTRTGINSFIITLGMGSMLTGLVLILTKAEAYRDLPKPFTRFGKERWVEIGWLELSPFIFIAAAVAVLVALLYRGTTMGRWMLATGANIRAAELSGVPVNRVIRFTHAVSGLLGGVAGIMLVSRLGSALPNLGGDWLLPSFAAPIIGGTLLSGGAVAPLGAVLGAILIESVSVGLTLMNVPSFWIQLFVGLVLLLAVLLDRARAVIVLRGQRGLVAASAPGAAR